ncbi:nucleotide exchange factor GrpE [Patescibacteria group bacterium]|nr:nucleotide exchange factor GrpE [Patescibacteria group bacterium]
MGDSGEEKEAEFVPEEEGEEGPALIKRLREKLKKAVEEKQEYLDGWQRARADFANYARQEAQFGADKEARAKVAVVEALLPALDSFELAFRHTPTKELEMLYKQLLDSLGKAGITQFGRQGELFDPHRHEALREEPTKEAADDHTVVTVERSGYTLDDFVIRPAQVSVGVYKKEL